MSKKKASMDDAERWLGEIGQDIKDASDLLKTGYDRGDWSEVVKAQKIMHQVQNHLSNLRHLAQPENWRILAKRNGLTTHLLDEEE